MTDGKRGEQGEQEKQRPVRLCWAQRLPDLPPPAGEREGEIERERESEA